MHIKHFHFLHCFTLSMRFRSNMKNGTCTASGIAWQAREQAKKFSLNSAGDLLCRRQEESAQEQGDEPVVPVSET
jgi:hypothetical protein